MTFFGIIWFFTLGVILLKKNIKNIIAITLFSMTLQCDNVLFLGNKGVGPQIITSLYFIVLSFTFKSKEDYNNKLIIKAFWVFFFLLSYCVFSAFENNGDILGLLQIIIYLFCAVRLYKLRGLLAEKEIVGIVKNILVFELVLGPFQLLSTIDVIPRTILRPFIYNDMGDSVYYNLGNYYFRILGSFMEPSFFSTYLVGSFFFIMHFKKEIKHFMLITLLIIFELILTMSSTGYLIFAVMLLLTMVLYKNKMMIRLYLPFIITLAIFVYITRDTLMKDILFDKMQSDSGKVRTMANLYAIQTFIDNKTYGIGYGNCRASSIIYTILAELGVIGMFLYSAFYFYFYKILRQYNANSKLFNASVVYLLSVILGQAISCPDLNMCTFWLGAYFLSLSTNSISRIESQKKQHVVLMYKNNVN